MEEILVHQQASFTPYGVKAIPIHLEIVKAAKQLQAMEAVTRKREAYGISSVLFHPLPTVTVLERHYYYELCFGRGATEEEEDVIWKSTLANCL